MVKDSGRRRPPARQAPDLDEITEAVAEQVELPLPHGPGLVLRPHRPDGSLLVYLHGATETERAIVSATDKAKMLRGLLDRGLTIAAAYAAGDAWDSLPSVDAYQALLREVRARWSTTGTSVLAESMGGLAAWQLVGEPPHLRRVVAIQPVCDLEAVHSLGRFTCDIELAHGADLAEALVRLGPAPVAGWRAYQCSSTPARTTRLSRRPRTPTCGLRSPALRGRAWSVTVRGDHSDPSHFDAARVVPFLAG